VTDSHIYSPSRTIPIALKAISLGFAVTGRLIGQNGHMQFRLLALSLALLTFSTGQPSAERPTETEDDGRAIILRALDRANWNEEQDASSLYRALMTKNIKRFDGRGDVTEEDQGDYEIVPINGVPFERRLTVGDRPLSDEERGWENDRELEFREAIRRSRERGKTNEEEEEDNITFNEELISRYTFTLESEEQYRNRPSYRVSFGPRSDRLPVRRRIDYALNKARGTVWIDQKTYEAARVEFELIDTVRLWWGVFGTINRARGSFDRKPVLGDTWARIQFETYTDHRVVFKRTRRSEFRQWREFEWVD